MFHSRNDFIFLPSLGEDLVPSLPFLHFADGTFDLWIGGSESHSSGLVRHGAESTSVVAPWGPQFLSDPFTEESSVHGTVRWHILGTQQIFAEWMRVGWLLYIVLLILSPTHPSSGFPDSSVDKESAYNAGDPGSIPGSGRSAGEGTGYPFQYFGASLVARLAKNPSAMWETWVRSLGWEDPLEKGKSTHSSTLV